MPSFLSATELKKNKASEAEERVTKLLNKPEVLSLLKAIAKSVIQKMPTSVLVVGIFY